MSDKYGNPDRFVLVERIEEWMEELIKYGEVEKGYIHGLPPNVCDKEYYFSRTQILKLIQQDACEF